MLDAFILSLRYASNVVLEDSSDNVSLACREVHKRCVDTDFGSDSQFVGKSSGRRPNVTGDEATGGRM
jgi:hypothetical protein